MRAQASAAEQQAETAITLVPFQRKYVPGTAYSPMTHAIKLQRPRFKQQKPSDFWKKK